MFAGKRVETRLIKRFGSGIDDFYYATYRWNTEETEATLVPAGGMPDAAPIGSNTSLKHDIPATEDCLNCHGKLEEHLLGFGAIQLSHDEGGLTLASLAAEGLLSVSPPAGGYPVPGDDVDKAALGYLHANCGGCHNDTGIVRPTPWRLRLLVAATTVEATDAYQTGVNVLHNWAGLGPEAGIVYRIHAGNPETSELAYRLNIRGLSQMPPIATKLVDRSAIAALNTWILRLKGSGE